MSKNPRVWGADLFLLEEWHETSSLSDDDQLLEIFSFFTRLPFAQRYIYTRRLEDREIKRHTDLPQADQDLLNRLRKPEERVDGGHIWLRTWYGEGSDAAFSSFIEGRDEEPEYPALQDANRYNYGGGGGWRRIFERLPQMLDPEGVSVDDYERAKQNALQECYLVELEDTREVEEMGGTPEEDGTYWMEMYWEYHEKAAVAVIFIADEEMIRAAAENPRSERFLAVWLDEMGRVVRYKRLAEGEASVLEMRMSVMGDALSCSAWMGAKPGEDYEWEGPLGPPALTGEGEHS
ncbi:hypothetical protein VPNG_00473 [Cytospora leucostoma]|uniref:Uncharacterized protein n=1 Tax=Cytospora leucostoma TaxID=1230097 RepID=A0A423XP59_9PEZI|nr:hypothetical protein VPNG_00473 [Cytospora leucostoma]